MKKRQFIAIGLLIYSFSVMAFSEEANTQPLFQYTIGISNTHFSGDGYFDLKSSSSERHAKSKVGYEAGISYHLGSHFEGIENLMPLRLSIDWADFARYSSYQNTDCSGQSCTRITNIDHQALMFNVHNVISHIPTINIELFAGLSHVYVDGKINDQRWDNNALGAQFGANFIPKQSVLIKPFVGIRLHGFEIEQNNKTAYVRDISVLFGLKF